MNKALKIGLWILAGILFLMGIGTLVYYGTRKLTVTLKKEGENVRVKVVKGFSSTESLFYLAQPITKLEKFDLYEIYIDNNGGKFGVNIYAGDIPVKGASLIGTEIKYYDGPVPV